MLLKINSLQFTVNRNRFGDLYRSLFFTILIIAVGNSKQIFPQEITEEERENQQETVDLLHNKRTLSEMEYEKKREGFYPTGVAGPFFSPDFGAGAGVILALFVNDYRNEPLFKYRPFANRILLGAFVSTGGFQEYAAAYDAPYLMGSLFRLRTKVTYSKNIAENYFGRGEDSLQKLSLPNGQTFNRFNEYSLAARTVDSQGFTLSKYNQYVLERAEWIVNFERDGIGGLIRYQWGLQLGKAFVTDYSGQNVSFSTSGGEDLNGIQRKTKLREDFEAGRISGFNGGWDNAVNLGIALDLRDYEANPKNGAFIDLTGNISSTDFGSSFNYQRLTFSPRFFYSPFPDFLDMVIATRALYNVNFGNTPFYVMDRILLSDRQIKGLGGLHSIRGFRQNRFVGKVAALFTLELRTTVAKVNWFNQDFQFMLAPFFDTGRIFDRVENTKFEGWKPSYGLGSRLIWNQATVILMDFGVGEEGNSFFFNVDHTF